ncbi:MAG: aminotransferase class V-fold PLP-dependent enzyme [Vicinamibacterales bacterium]
MSFGKHMLEHWSFEPGLTYLNHGTVGVTPRRVLDIQHAIRDAIERQPSRFMLRELTRHGVGRPRTEMPRLREAAHVVAEFLGVEGDDLAFVDNSTTGANGVLRSMPLRPGDEILLSDFGYGGIVRAAQFAARERGATVRTVAMPYPVRSADEVVHAFTSAIGPRTTLALVDHVSSESALVLPVAEIAAGCRERGVALLVDGAHAPGALPVDIGSLGADWYVANLHKWLWVPRNSGILWASPERQHGLHPAVISWGLDQGFTAEFDAPGTRDPSAHLTAPHAIAFMRELGVRDVQQHNHALAWRGGHLLAERWGTPFVTPESMIGTMATVMLPERLGSTPAHAARVRDVLLEEHRIEVHVHAFRERLYARISAQIYNDLQDVEQLADVVSAME